MVKYKCVQSLQCYGMISFTVILHVYNVVSIYLVQYNGEVFINFASVTSYTSPALLIFLSRFLFEIPENVLTTVIVVVLLLLFHVSVGSGGLSWNCCLLFLLFCFFVFCFSQKRYYGSSIQEIIILKESSEDG